MAGREGFAPTVVCGLAIAAATVFAACGGKEENRPEYPWGIDPDSLPSVVTEADFPDLPRGSADRIWGLAGKDLTDKDLTRLSLPFLAALTFDGNTRWPERTQLPEGFSPEDWIETGKNPGLGVRALHRQGITGKGIAVAIVDKPIRHEHREFRGRIHYYEVFDGEEEGRAPHFHGIACASILAGETVGVAPEATIHYFAVPDVGGNFHYYSIAADRIIEVNGSLNDAQKIRLVSISDGLGRDNPYRDEWRAALERLQEAGVEVVYSSRGRLDEFVWGGVAPYEDREIASNYDLALYLAGMDVPREEIIIPGDYRTTASNKGEDLYIYWGTGGWSWAIPYAAGLAALAWQLEPALTYAEIESVLRETAVAARDGRRVIDPTAFVEALGTGAER